MFKINYHSIWALLNNKDSIIFCATAKNEMGLSQTTNKIKVVPNANSEQLAYIILDTFSLCEKEPLINENNNAKIEECLGYSSWSKFINNHKLVQISNILDSKMYKFSPMKKTKGGYIRSNEDPTFRISLLECNDEEILGKTLIKAFSYCT
ncbi:hypothetical protein [Paenibacillus aestuarii]|uniref:hypothetical protein n=1 Tax=Paenibacillus aestuarii TaxID=516965 RepID=UPI0022E9C95B|nr:hypothetical protein [Paenibacillus aestuarii]